jgi:hypothetical protein
MFCAGSVHDAFPSWSLRTSGFTEVRFDSRNPWIPFSLKMIREFLCKEYSLLCVRTRTIVGFALTHECEIFGRMPSCTTGITDRKPLPSQRLSTV